MTQNHLDKHLDELCKIYGNLTLMGDDNCEISEDAMNELCCVYNLNNLVSKPTCFKTPDHPSYIDLILTNKPASFKNTSVTETGLSTVMIFTFQKQLPKLQVF